MTHVLTLVTAPTAPALDNEIVARASKALDNAEGSAWLSPGEACDIYFTPEADTPRGEFAERVRDALQNAPIDVIAQHADARRKRLLVADMDSTLIGQECIDELADFAGLKPKIAAITERAMRGELTFEPALRERVGLLKGLGEEVLARVFAERITLNPGARTLARTMHTHGARTVVVSGGFSFFTRRVAEAAGFDTHQANELEVAEGKLTGRVVEPILGQQAKLDALRRHRDALKLAHAETLAVGDGANDLAMLEEAGLGVAYRAKPIVVAGARARIDHGDLTVLLFVQGYGREDFVGD